MKPVDPEAPEEAHAVYQSPVIAKRFDRVERVDEAEITVRTHGDRYTLEASIPLAALGLTPATGLQIRGDVVCERERQLVVGQRIEQVGLTPGRVHAAEHRRVGQVTRALRGGAHRDLVPPSVATPVVGAHLDQQPQQRRPTILQRVDATDLDRRVVDAAVPALPCEERGQQRGELVGERGGVDGSFYPVGSVSSNQRNS